MNFECTGCSLCCRRFDLIHKYKNEQPLPILGLINQFPYKHDKDGVCEMLDEDGQCKVYDDRPGLCNIEKIYDDNPSLAESKEDFYLATYKACNILIKDNKYPDKYLINLEDE